MSDHVSVKHVLSNAKSRESMDPYQSLWMSHWMQTSQNPLSQVHQHRTIDEKNRDEAIDAKQGQTPVQIAEFRKAKRLDADVTLGDISEYKNKGKQKLGDFEVVSDVLQSAQGLVPDTRGIELMSKSLMRNSKDLSFPALKSTQLDMLSIGKLSGSSVHHENFSTPPPFPYFKNMSLEQQTFEKFNLNEDMEGVLSPITDFTFCDRLRPQLDGKSKYGAADIGTSVQHLHPRVLSPPPNEFHLEAEGKQGTAENQIKLNYFDKKIVPFVRPLHDEHTVSNSNSMLLKFRGPHRIIEGDRSSSGLSHKGQLGNTHFTSREPEHCDYHNYSTFFASEAKMDRKLKAEGSGSQCSGQKDGAMQLYDDPMIGDFRFPILLREQGRTMKKFSVTGLLPSHSSAQGTSLEDLKCQRHLLHRMPTCCHDMETLGICTTVDSVEGVPGGLAKFSKTTHHLFITKKADMNLSKGDQMIKESTVSAEPKGKAFHKMLYLPLGFGCCDEQEAKFRPLGKLADSEDKEDGNAVMTGIQNESSAETDSMPIDFNQSKNPPAGLTSSLSHEDFLAGKSARKSLEGAASQNKEGRIRKEVTELPDMNEELPADLVAVESVDGRELSTSRTESLDVEHLLSHVEQPENSNSSPQPGNRLDPEPSSRWVKRLRLSASDSHALGTKSLKMGDASSSDKVNKLFNRITSYRKTNSETTLGKCHGKRLQQFDKTAILLGSVDSSGGSVKDCRDPTLSHSWIRRWCRNREATIEASPAPQVACEPEKSKFSLQELQKKQFPSIAAMALMGKAVSSFRPCEFRKRGSSIVWNT